MADINVTCGQCGNELTVSEYTGGSTIKCPDCDSEIEVLVAPTSRLSLRPKEDTSTALAGDDRIEVAEASRRELFDDPTQAIAHVHKMRRDIKNPKNWLTYLVFVVLAGGMIGVQHKFSADAAMMDTYATVRNVLGGAIYLLILYTAFGDGYLQGSLCLFLPPYMVYYALARIERPIVVGLVIGITAALVAEVFYMGGASALAILQGHTDQLIRDVGGMIEDAGRKVEFEN